MVIKKVVNENRKDNIVLDRKSARVIDNNDTLDYEVVISLCKVCSPTKFPQAMTNCNEMNLDDIPEPRTSTPLRKTVKRRTDHDPSKTSKIGAIAGEDALPGDGTRVKPLMPSVQLVSETHKLLSTPPRGPNYPSPLSGCDGHNRTRRVNAETSDIARNASSAEGIAIDEALADLKGLSKGIDIAPTIQDLGAIVEDDFSVSDVVQLLNNTRQKLHQSRTVAHQGIGTNVQEKVTTNKLKAEKTAPRTITKVKFCDRIDFKSASFERTLSNESCDAYNLAKPLEANNGE